MTKISFPIIMFVLMTSGKFVLHIYFTFYNNSNLLKAEIIYFFSIIYDLMYNN